MCVITSIRRNYGFEKEAHTEYGSHFCTVKLNNMRADICMQNRDTRKKNNNNKKEEKPSPFFDSLRLMRMSNEDALV